MDSMATKCCGQDYPTCKSCQTKSTMVFGVDLSKFVEKPPHPITRASIRATPPLTHGVTSYHIPQRKESWTLEERCRFLVGMKKLGKGNWRGISKYYVPTKTALQVASHAQKHFLRLEALATGDKKYRPSIFDITLDQMDSALINEIIESSARPRKRMRKFGLTNDNNCSNETTPIDHQFGIQSELSDSTSENQWLEHHI